LKTSKIQKFFFELLPIKEIGEKKRAKINDEGVKNKIK